MTRSVVSADPEPTVRKCVLVGRTSTPTTPVSVLTTLSSIRSLTTKAPLKPAKLDTPALPTLSGTMRFATALLGPCASSTAVKVKDYIRTTLASVSVRKKLSM